MNESERTLDAPNQHGEEDLQRAAAADEYVKEEPGVSHAVGPVPLESGTDDSTETESQVPCCAQCERCAQLTDPAEASGDVQDGDRHARGAGEEPAGETAEAYASPDQTSQEEADGQAPPGEQQEPSPRRVVLQAGTDEASLKALALCREKVSQLHLRMHPLAARWESDRHVIIFFRADDKVDFRKLVRELSRLLHARIELRQVGPREQGKLCGLVGKCGYPLCCQTFLGQFAQSTIKMAKTQELALNPMKISGVCGRLLCCLNYEQEMYLEAKSRMPRVNKVVETELGPGRVVAVNVLKQTVTVQLETTTRELRPDQILPSEAQG